MRHWSTRHWRPLVFIALATCLGCGTTPADTAAHADGAASHSDERPNAATDGVTLKTLDYRGLQALLASHRGKIVVLDCWSTT